MNDPALLLQEISKAPEDSKEFETWLELGDAKAFLIENARQDDIILHAVMAHAFVHGVAVPNRLVSPPDVDDLMLWNSDVSSGWGLSITLSKPQQVSISPPLSGTGSKTLDGGEQLVFPRYFEGHLGKKSYYEFLQKFIQTFGLHFVSERNAYCRLDERGDVEEVIRIVTVPGDTGSFEGTIVAAARNVIDEYLVLTDSSIVRAFDFTRFRSGHFGGWSAPPEAKASVEEDMFFRSAVEPGNVSYMRGTQVVRPLITKEDLLRRHAFPEAREKPYVSFIAHDWKNGTVREISAAPSATSNYFVRSNLPFELSPAFFRPEVLMKYKADSEKYQLKDRSIYCRGTWHLKTYDINEAGQVHTYIVYLRDLPYEEQLYWKSYNEAPKGPISRRAIKTDFEGDWNFDYDALGSLKALVRGLVNVPVPWWTLRSPDLVDKVHYPITSSADEWSNEILHLDQLLIEGFEEKWLRQKAISLGRKPELADRSLRLVEECLIGFRFEREHAKDIVSPMRIAHNLRSLLKGHAAGALATAAKKKALREFGTYHNHFRTLCQGCDESMRTISEAFSGPAASNS